MTYVSDAAFAYRDRQGDWLCQITPRLRARIETDPHPIDPFKDCDGHWPMLVKQRRDNIEVKVEVPGDLCGVLTTIAKPWRWFTDEGIVFNQRELFSILGISDEMIALWFDMSETIDPKRWVDSADTIVDIIRDHEPDITFELRDQVLELAGVLALDTTATGPSQGDWANLLIFAPREVIERHRGAGATEEQVRADMQAQADLYEAWASNDCYCYIVETLDEGEDPDGEDFDDDDVWSVVDSCGDYYGYDHDKSGLCDAVNETLTHSYAESIANYNDEQKLRAA